MQPKLAAKAGARAAGVSPEASFWSRAVSAQIGWLETSLPSAAAEAIGNVELLLLSGAAEHSDHIHHQLIAFIAHESGLLATWETQNEILCVPTMTGDQA